MTILAAITLTIGGSTLAVPEGSNLSAFLDSVATDAGYLAIRDDGGSAGSDGGDGGDHQDFGQTDGLSPRDKTGASSA